MKTKILLILSVFLAVLLAGSALAADFNVSATSISRDDAVQRSNPLMEGDDNKLDDRDELEYATFTLTLSTGNNNVTISGIDISGLTYDSFDDEVSTDDEAKFDETFPFTIAANSTKTVDVDVLVPSDLDSIDSSFNWLQHSATATVSASDATTKSTSLDFYVENGLELDNVDISANQDFSCDVDEHWTESLDCDDEAEELLPGEDFDVTFEITNIFDDDSELDFEDVEMELDSDNNDIEADDDNQDEDIDADSTYTLRVNYEVDSDVEDGDDVEIEIQVSVEDENGALHGFKHTFKLEFEVPDYDVTFDVGTLSSSNVCAGDYISIPVKVTNKGSKDQDTLYLTLVDNNLGWNRIENRFSLDGEDDGDYESESFDLRMQVPKSAKDGKYNPSVTLYYEDDDKDDASEYETITLTVSDCDASDNDSSSSDNDNDSSNSGSSGMVVSGSDNGSSTTNTNAGSNGNTAGQTTDTTAQPTSSTVVTAQPRETNTWFVVGMVLIVVILLAVVLSLVAYLFRK